MSSTTAAPERPKGRPKVKKPKRRQINFRADDELYEAIEAYRQKYERARDLGEISQAVRQMLVKVLIEEGLLGSGVKGQKKAG